jgi:ribonucleoside-diphosphate reductase alpha chain
MPVWYREGKILSCSDAIAKAIEWHLQEESKNPKTCDETKGNIPKGNSERRRNPLQIETVPIFLRGACPECGGSLLFEEGCVKCLCGYSDCG